MGAVYKKKRHSCAICKPHKMRGEPKRTPRERQKLKLAKQEIRKVTGRG